MALWLATGQGDSPGVAHPEMRAAYTASFSQSSMQAQTIGIEVEGGCSSEPPSFTRPLKSPALLAGTEPEVAKFAARTGHSGFIRSFIGRSPTRWINNVLSIVIGTPRQSSTAGPFTTLAVVRSMGSSGRMSRAGVWLWSEPGGFNLRGGLECRDSAEEGPPALIRESKAVRPWVIGCWANSGYGIRDASQDLGPSETTRAALGQAFAARSQSCFLMLPSPRTDPPNITSQYLYLVMWVALIH